MGTRTPAPPCTARATPRCTGRRSAAIAESSDCSSHPAPTCTPRTRAGAPFALAANRPLSAPAESPPPSAVQAHAAALCRVQWPFRNRRGAAAARRRRGRPEHRRVPLRCAAQPKPNPQQPRACRETPKQQAERNGMLTEYEAGESQVHSARRLTAPPPPFNAAGVPTDTPSVLAVGIRRSSGQGADAALALLQAPSPCTIAPAGRSVEHVARELLLPSAAQSAHAHAVLCRAQRGGKARSTRKRTCRATQCELAVPPTQPTDLSLVLQAEQHRSAFDEVRPPRRARRSPQRCQCSHHNTSVLGQVLIVRTRALVLFRSNPISANAPQTLRHC